MLNRTTGLSEHTWMYPECPFCKKNREEGNPEYEPAPC